MQEFVPVGLLSLKAAADEAGVGDGVRVVELNGLVNRGIVVDDDDFYRNVADAVTRPDDDAVGLMTDADSLHHTIAIAEEVKRRSPHTAVWLGGPAASPLARDLLEAFPAIDAVARGEAEYTFVQLLERAAEGQTIVDVDGLTWRDSDAIVENAPRELVRDLDTLPIPAYDHFDTAGPADLYLDVGRGCPFTCEFCATAPFWSRTYRMKTIDRIVTEMTLMRDRFGRDHVNFSHDIFTCNRKWTAAFCQRLIDLPIGMTWTCSTRTDISNPELLELMAAGGCVEIYYGIESGSDVVQTAISKNLDLNWAREIVRATARVGIRPIFGFIVGYPMETRETLDATLRRYFEFFRVGGFRGHLFTLCPFAEAPMYKRFGETARRPARDYVLPLVGPAAKRADRLKSSHRTIFAASHRYDTPDLDQRLVDASEELSATISQFTTLLPRVVELYDSPLDWYERWVAWIERANSGRLGRARTPLLGDARDLLVFVQDELARIGGDVEDLAELARYESLRLLAAELPQNPFAADTDGGPPRALGPDATVVRACEYVLGRFMHDPRSLLTAERAMRTPVPRSVIFAKLGQDRVATLQVNDLAASLLALAGRPRRVDHLLEEVGRAGGGLAGDGFAVTERLVELGLMRVAG